MKIVPKRTLLVSLRHLMSTEVGSPEKTAPENPSPTFAKEMLVSIPATVPLTGLAIILRIHSRELLTLPS